jgi:hypothetical protein
VAHPVAPSEEEIAAATSRLVASAERWSYQPDVGRAPKRATRNNVRAAGRWLRWLRREFPETTFIAPWMVSILTGDDDSDPAQREAGLADCCATVERCDGIVLCGPRISSGMRREMEHGEVAPHHYKIFDTYDLTKYGWRDPSDVIVDGMLHVTFEEWHEVVFESAATLKRVQ